MFFKTSHIQKMAHILREMKRPPAEEGTDELVDQYKEDTPGQGEEVEEHCGVCGEQGIEEKPLSAIVTSKAKGQIIPFHTILNNPEGWENELGYIDAKGKRNVVKNVKGGMTRSEVKKILNDIRKKHSVKEEVELDEKGTAYPATVDTLRKIVKDKQHQTVMFKSGQALVDLFSASAIIAVYDGMKKPELKKKLEDMIKSKEGFLKTQSFAMKMVK